MFRESGTGIAIFQDVLIALQIRDLLFALDDKRSVMTAESQVHAVSEEEMNCD